MSTFFVADVHLSEQQPAITASFLQFLANDATQADSLYILGDLFEIWVGDDDPHSLHRQVATALKLLHQQGIHCYFMHGNRDFLLGAAFANESGMTLLPEQKVLECHGHKLLILHGDTLCTDDINYQNFRKIVRNRLVKRLFLWLPLKLRLSIATLMRQHSQQTSNRKSEHIMDVNTQAVITLLQQHHVDGIIHGHTHRPAIHDIKYHTHPAQRAVLGAWHTQGSVIKVSADAIELVQFPLGS